MPKPNALQDIDEMKRGQLTGKYYVPDIDIVSTTIEEDFTVNPLPVTWNPDTSTSTQNYYNGGYRINSSVNRLSETTSFPLAFDDNLETAFVSIANTAFSANPSFTITLPAMVAVTKFRLRIRKSNLSSIEIRGSSKETATVTASDWDSLYKNNAASSINDTTTTITINNPALYKHYRLLINSGDQESTYLYEFQIVGYRAVLREASLHLDGVPIPLSLNQRIMIKTPDYDPTGLTSMKFNGLDVDAILLPNRYYEFVYDGIMYRTKEVV